MKFSEFLEANTKFGVIKVDNNLASLSLDLVLHGKTLRTDGYMVPTTTISNRFHNQNA